MLRGSLKALGDADGLLAAAGLDGARRAETLSVAEFERLAEALRARG
jgi:16S rRNA (adenine1518-N6/adenine1519-N6)-dimethyltransferase